MIAMLVGTSLALMALAFVLYPLFREPLGAAPAARNTEQPHTPTAVDALREIEFDHATGKLSDRDYSELRTTYTERALAAMRSARMPSCVTCGPRTEEDARFCSDCGRSLL